MSEGQTKVDAGTEGGRSKKKKNLKLSRQRNLWSICLCPLLVVRLRADHSTSLSFGFLVCKVQLTTKLLRGLN